MIRGWGKCTLTRVLPALAGTAAIVLFSCSEQESATGPDLQTTTLEQVDEFSTQPAPVPGKGQPERPPYLEPLPEEIESPVAIESPDLTPADDGRYVPEIPYLGTFETGTTTKVIDGTLGGTIERGPFRVDVPANSVEGDVQFKVEIPDDGTIQVHLTPHGMTFDKPVVLTVDLRIASGLGENVALFWWNQKQERWDNIGGTFDPDTKQLVTNLDHFSTYAPGRAGWTSGPGKTKDSDNKTKK